MARQLFSDHHCFVKIGHVDNQLESHLLCGVRLLLESLRTKIFLAVGALIVLPRLNAPVFARLALGITRLIVVEGIFFFPLIGGVDRDRVGGERNGEWTCERAAV